MGWQHSVVVVGCFLTHSTHAFAPITWMQAPNGGCTLMPKGFKGWASKNTVPPQQLVIGSPEKSSPGNVPYFTAKLDNSIIWDDMGWCVEARGRASGDVVFVNQCNGDALQKWTWIPDGHGRNMIQLKNSNKCIDVKNGNLHEASIELRDCASQGTGAWKFEAPIPFPTLAPATKFGIHQVPVSLLSIACVGMLSLGAWMWRPKNKARVVTVGQAGVPMSTFVGGDPKAKIRPMANAGRTEGVSMMAGGGSDMDGPSALFPAFSSSSPSAFTASQGQRVGIPSMGASPRTNVDELTNLEYYDHEGFSCAYRHKLAAPGYEKWPPLMLVHPVGIGLDSWFWQPFMDIWPGEAFAPDLLGCGRSEAWDPSERGLFFPLDWVRAIETLWRLHIQRPVAVVSQGGLAPVGVCLAARETELWRGSRAVCALVLTSPPGWAEMTTEKPQGEVKRNFGFAQSRLGNIAYRVLRSRRFVKFFSNLFLFEEKADERWLEKACNGATDAVRWPVFAFNAGLLNTRSYEPELQAIGQPTLVLSGTADRRAEQREPYAAEMTSCELHKLAGLNVMPWEVPSDFAKVLTTFITEKFKLDREK